MNSTGRALTPAGGELSFHPVTTIQTKSGRPFWYQIICSPVSAEETVLRCDVYSAHNSTMSNYEGAVKDGLEQELAQKVQGFEAVFARLRQSKERLDHMSGEIVTKHVYLSGLGAYRTISRNPGTNCPSGRCSLGKRESHWKGNQTRRCTAASQNCCQYEGRAK